MKILFSFRSLALSGLFLIGSSHRLLACAACYGDTTGSKMGEAATWGIIAMTIIMFVMLGAVGGFIWYLAYRAKHPLPDYTELMADASNHVEPGTSS